MNISNSVSYLSRALAADSFSGDDDRYYGGSNLLYSTMTRYAFLPIYFHTKIQNEATHEFPHNGKRLQNPLKKEEAGIRFLHPLHD